MTVPPIKSKHVVSTKHFVTAVIEDLLHGADLKHLLNMHLFKPAKKFTLADKESEGSVASFVTIGIDIFPDVRVVFLVFGECLRVEMLGNVSLSRDVEDKQTRGLEMV